VVIMKTYLYRDQTGFGGTLIVWRIGIRWGSHAAYFKSRVVLYLESGIKKVL
jgi:hypothetical protein